MCGILALCGIPAQGPVTEDQIVAARDVMQSRGPDGAGYLQASADPAMPVHMAHRRLAIQDLSPSGAQPMVSASGRFVMTYNGEVYNAPDLRRRLEALGVRFTSDGDSQVILEGFAQWGTDVVAMLNGIFAFAIWDRQDQRLTVVRDRIGIKPLYLAQERGCLALASDARALRRLGFGAEMDRDALALYLSLGYVPAPWSIWSGITKLDAGTILEWTPDGNVTRQSYWQAPTEIDQSGTPQDLAHLIDGVVEEQLLSDVPVGVFLSGGIDSSLIASSLAEMGRTGSGIQALTVGFPGQREADESDLARQTADRLGLPLQVLPMTQSARHYMPAAVAALDEPLAFSAIVTQAAISQLARDAGLTVVLTGDGGDEGFAGYSWYKTPIAGAPPPGPPGLAERLLPHRRRWYRQVLRDHDWAQSSFLGAHAQTVYAGLRPDQVAALTGQSEQAVAGLIHRALSQFDAPDLPEIRRRQRLDLYAFCGDVVLTKVDRTGMAFGIEARPPLLDHRIIDWALSRPVDPGAAPKAALRAILKSRGLGFLLDAPKRGFSLKAKDKPSRRVMRQDVSAAAASLGLASDWAKVMPAETRHYSQRLALLHWLALWRGAVT